MFPWQDIRQEAAIDKQTLTVGGWRIQPEANLIKRDGVEATIQPLSMDILVYLARRAGEVVTAQELLDTFWARRVVGDDAVHRRIADLRRHLGDDARNPQFILTIPKRGYRLIADVRWAAPVESQAPTKSPYRSSWPVVAVAIIAVVAVGVFVPLGQDAGLDAAIDAARSHVSGDRYQAAFDALESYSDDDDPRVAALMREMMLPATVLTDPPGIEVRYRFADGPGQWTLLGTTPISEVTLPRGDYRLRFGGSVFMNATHPGATLNSAGIEPRTVSMPRTGVPDDMVYVPAGNYRLGAWGFDRETNLGEFLLDRTEVTNARYLEFVESGGYGNRELWQPIIDAAGNTLSWADVGRLFVDRTGAPGPAGWSFGTYTPGEQDLPVVGVSWYEAMAYLAWQGKTLPAVQHWLRATLSPMEWKYPFAPFLVPVSNIAGSALADAASHRGSESSGAFDLIGNAAEWTVSGGPAGQAVIGASFHDPAWAYNFPSVVDPLERRDDIGFRGIRFLEGSVRGPWQDVDYFEDYTSSVRRVSDEMFEGMLLGFRYREGTIKAEDARVVDESISDHWVRRLIELPTSHADDPLPVYLYLPKRTSGPLQSVIYLPPADSWSPGFRSESIRIENYQLDFIPRSGRALIWPVYFGSQERYDQYHAVPGPGRSSRALERNHRIRDEIGRIIDFLDSSPEFDGDRVGLIGLSHGAMLASYNLAAEHRIRAAVLYSVGLAMPNPVFANPQNDPNVYWARVTQPTLIINGRYDPIRPHHVVLEPLIELLATPAGSKRSLLYDSSHWPLPRYQLMRDTLEWFDQHLGPVATPDSAP